MVRCFKKQNFLINMDLTFFFNKNILEAGTLFFKEILNIDIAQAAKSEISVKEFLKDFLTDIKLLDKISDARFIGLINELSIEGKEQIENVDDFLKHPSEDYDMLLVFGLLLKDGIIPTKSDISRLTRALNRRSSNRPVILLIKYSDRLSFSAAERGQYQKKGQKGEKVGRISILRDIDLNKVHAGHERILLQLRINPLETTTFKGLYEQWLEVFNLKTLNNDFYKKIADWYFWATKVVKFPIDHYKTIQGNENKTDKELQEEANQIALIRFITRIIFVWFLKSKDIRIIPLEIFDNNELKNHLRFTDEYKSNYYKAILQNLFFASFNTKIDSPQRTFSERKRTTFLENRYRYASLFINPERSIKKLFSNIPFLNGGLFSNLDYKISDRRTVRVDWFSDPAEGFPKNKLYFPDFLFFDKEHEEDLSSFYETKAKQKVKGLIPILKEYYFTIEENTPLEQEIALDPELLGKIFENLLASYNPETRSTARKQTGSYYTPREIVNYMVDQSLITFLITKLTEKVHSFHELGNQQTNIFGNEGKEGQLSMQVEVNSEKWINKEPELETKLRALFGYASEINPFENDKETTKAIITHLSECKILDPACGSGAFPMGVLHQIVHALKKLDKDNEKWKQVQYERLISPEVSKITMDISTVQKLSSEEARKKAEKQLKHELEELLENFARHDHNYTRKLHLIENCIYGVDIQPIAIHISKLRFFISLLVDQKIDFSQRNKNYLLNPLPNLETKFVAANTLIPLNAGGQLTTREEKIIDIERSITFGRKKYFDCKSRDEKLVIERKDEALRKEFAYELKRLTELGRNNLLKHIEKIEIEIEIHKRYKTKAKTDKEKERITKGIDTKKKDLEKYRTKLIQFAGGDEVSNKILHFNPFDANSSAPFFDSEIMFTLRPDTGGGFFDVVIGNPPYLESRNSAFDKKLKNQLQSLVQTKWGEFAKYITKGSDLLIYFFETAIKTINENGIITFLTQNSWLDTEYGKKFQTFLLNKTYVTALIDSDFKYFDDKDGPNINTVISIFKGKQPQNDNPTYFTRFHESFQNINYSFDEIAKSNDHSIASIKIFKGNDLKIKEIKWGVLLTSNSAFLQLLNILKLKGKRISEFKNLNVHVGQGLNISKEYVCSNELIQNYSFLKKGLIPFFTGSEGAYFNIKSTDNFLLNNIKFNKDELNNLKKLGINSVDQKILKRDIPTLILPRGIGRHYCAYNSIQAYSSSFVEVYVRPHNSEDNIHKDLWLFFNSTLGWLLREVYGRKNLGGGMLKAEAVDLHDLPIIFSFNTKPVDKLFKTLDKREVFDCLHEINTYEHEQIDQIVNNHLGISESFFNELKALTINLIETRSKKSKS